MGSAELVLALGLLVALLVIERLSLASRRAAKVEQLVRQRTQELSEANRKLGELSRLKDEFVAQVSHELRTPLAIIREGIAQVLDGICGQPTPLQSETLAISLRNIDRLQYLIEDLLDLSEIECGTMPLAKAPFDLTALAMELCRHFERQAVAKDLRLKVRVPDQRVEVLADRERIAQVFSKLLGNAIKFTDQGEVELSVERKGDLVYCTVSDTGPGISEEQIPRLFQKFEQLAPVSSGVRKGTGLGLSICKGVVDQHGGKIWFEAASGRGARFIFILPSRREEARHAA